MILLDTNILSELMRPAPEAALSNGSPTSPKPVCSFPPSPRLSYAMA